MTTTPVSSRASAVLLLLLASTTCAAESSAWASAGYVDELDGIYSRSLAVSWRTGGERAWEASVMRMERRDLEGASGKAQHVVTIARRIAFGRFHVLGGLGLNSEDDEVLSGHAQFLSGFGFGTGRTELSLRHLSNAGLRGRNRGETWLSLSVRLWD